MKPSRRTLGQESHGPSSRGYFLNRPPLIRIFVELDVHYKIDISANRIRGPTPMLTEDAYQHFALFRDRLIKQDILGVNRGPVLIDVPRTKSHLIANNGYKVYASLLPKLGGLFSKNSSNGLAFCTELCALVRKECNCGGFFTSDEIPRYGVSRSDLKVIQTVVGWRYGDLIFLYCYSLEAAKAVDQFVRQCLLKLATSN